MFIKAPSDVLDFEWDWAGDGWLDEGDTIYNVSFTLEDGLTIPNLKPPGDLLATGNPTGGVLAAATYYWVITAIDPLGDETTRSNEATATLTTDTSSVVLSWLPTAYAAQYRIYRGTAAGAENVIVATVNALAGVTNSFTDTGTVASAPVTAEFTIPGTYNYQLPAWANTFDIVALGAGAGSFDTSFGDYGGGAGAWNAITVTIPGSLPTTTTDFTVTVGAGGAGEIVTPVPGFTGGDITGSAQNGSPSVVALNGYGTVTAAGGTIVPGTTQTYNGEGAGPGDFTFDGVTYVGGAAAASGATVANAPGGGAPAGTTNSDDGYPGAPGAVWIRASQNNAQATGTPPTINNTTSVSFTPTTASVFIAGGALNTTYTVTCQITTAAGRTSQFTETLYIQSL